MIPPYSWDVPGRNPPFAVGELCGLLRFGFDLQADHVEIRPVRQQTVGRVEQQRRHADLTGGDRACRRPHQRAYHQPRAGVNRLLVTGDGLFRVFTDGVDAYRQRGRVGQLRGGEKAIAQGLGMAAKGAGIDRQ